MYKLTFLANMTLRRFIDGQHLCNDPIITLSLMIRIILIKARGPILNNLVNLWYLMVEISNVDASDCNEYNDSYDHIFELVDEYMVRIDSANAQKVPAHPQKKHFHCPHKKLMSHHMSISMCFVWVPYGEHPTCMKAVDKPHASNFCLQIVYYT